MSAEQADWSRESKAAFVWNPSKSLVGSLRDYQRYAASSNLMYGVLKAWAVLRHRFWSAITGADIPLNCQIAGGVLFPHPNGVVIHPAARIGVNALIFQQVTIGTLGGTAGAPLIEGHVDIGAGAKILGPVRIGKHALIGANAVVLSDVPDHCIAVGIPAVVKIRQSHGQ